MEYPDQTFNIYGPTVSARGEAESYLNNRIIKGNNIWYYHDGKDAGDQIYCSTPNKQGMGGATTSMSTKDGIFEETGIWHSNSKSLYDATGVDLRNNHKLSYAICLEPQDQGHYQPYSIKQVLVVKNNLITYFDEGRDKAQELANELNKKVFLLTNMTGGGSAGWVKPISTS